MKEVTRQMSERQTEVEALLLRGWTQRAIARKLGVSSHTVSRDVKALRSEWKQARVRNYEGALSLELEKLNNIEREAWAAWEQSKNDEEKTKVSTEGGGKKRAERATATQTGDLRFLELVLKCIERRCKMQGLDDPLDHLVRDTYCVAARELGDDELRALSKLRERLCNDEVQIN